MKVRWRFVSLLSPENSMLITMFSMLSDTVFVTISDMWDCCACGLLYFCFFSSVCDVSSVDLECRKQRKEKKDVHWSIILFEFFKNIILRDQKQRFCSQNHFSCAWKNSQNRPFPQIVPIVSSPDNPLEKGWKTLPIALHGNNEITSLFSGFHFFQCHLLSLSWSNWSGWISTGRFF